MTVQARDDRGSVNREGDREWKRRARQKLGLPLRLQGTVVAKIVVDVAERREDGIEPVGRRERFRVGRLRALRQASPLELATGRNLDGLTHRNNVGIQQAVVASEPFDEGRVSVNTLRD